MEQFRHQKSKPNIWIMAGVVINAIVGMLRATIGMETNMICFLQGIGAGLILLGLVHMIFNMERVKNWKRNRYHLEFGKKF